MFEVQFFATDDADWAQAVDLFDDDTGERLDTDGMSFAFAVTEDGTALLTASTDDGGIVTPEAGVIQWHFTRADLGALCPGTTYRVGCTVTTTDGPTQLFVGTLAFIDGSAP